MTGVRILVDADACPVKEEIYKVAFRHDVPAVIVSNAYLRVPDHPLLSRIVVADRFETTGRLDRRLDPPDIVCIENRE